MAGVNCLPFQSSLCFWFTTLVRCGGHGAKAGLSLRDDQSCQTKKTTQNTSPCSTNMSFSMAVFLWIAIDGDTITKRKRDRKGSVLWASCALQSPDCCVLRRAADPVAGFCTGHISAFLALTNVVWRCQWRLDICIWVHMYACITC